MMDKRTQITTPEPIPAYLRDLCIASAANNGALVRGTIYRALFRAARLSRPCPTNEILCEITGRVHSTVVYHKRELERRGLIRVTSHQRGQQVLIVQTGRSTRPAVDGSPHWRDRRGLKSFDSRWSRDARKDGE